MSNASWGEVSGEQRKQIMSFDETKLRLKRLGLFLKCRGSLPVASVGRTYGQAFEEWTVVCESRLLALGCHELLIILIE